MPESFSNRLSSQYAKPTHLMKSPTNSLSRRKLLTAGGIAAALSLMVTNPVSGGVVQAQEDQILAKLAHARFKKKPFALRVAPEGQVAKREPKHYKDHDKGKKKAPKAKKHAKHAEEKKPFFEGYRKGKKKEKKEKREKYKEKS